MKQGDTSQAFLHLPEVQNSEGAWIPAVIDPACTIRFLMSGPGISLDTAAEIMDGSTIDAQYAGLQVLKYQPTAQDVAQTGDFLALFKVTTPAPESLVMSFPNLGAISIVIEPDFQTATTTTSRSVAYSQVLQAACSLMGIPPEQLNAEEEAHLRLFAAKRLQIAWAARWWPELMNVEQRWYRPAWASDSVYAAGAEVWYGTASKYYRAVRQNTNAAPDAFPLDWAEATDLIRYVPRDHSGLTSIGEVRGITLIDPRTSTRSAPVLLEEISEGWLVRTTATAVWVDYREECPALEGEAYDATDTYAGGDQVVFTSTSSVTNFYRARMAIAAGESPEIEPAKWDLIAIPKRFAQYLAQGIYADWLTKEGQNEKTAAAEDQAAQILMIAAGDSNVGERVVMK